MTEQSYIMDNMSKPEKLVGYGKTCIQMTIDESKITNKNTRPSPKLSALVAAFLLLSSCTSCAFVNNAGAQTESSLNDDKTTRGPCGCVIFRMDDANSDFLSTVQLGIMNTFISKDSSVSLGLIMHKINPESAVVEKIKEGKAKGLFELDIHGWDHVNYAQLSPEDQLSTLLQANSKMHTVFGQYSKVFIPPYNKFDGDTIGILKPAGIGILSADTSSDKASYFVALGKGAVGPNPSLYHLPAMATFKSDNGNGTWIKIPISSILDMIDVDVSRYGYSVVMLHPQNFAKTQNGIFVDTVDENEIKDLSSLIGSVKSKNLRITTFEDITGLNQYHVSSSHIQTIPEFHGMEVVALAVSIFATIGFAAMSKSKSTLNGF